MCPMSVDCWSDRLVWSESLRVAFIVTFGGLEEDLVLRKQVRVRGKSGSGNGNGSDSVLTMKRGVDLWEFCTPYEPDIIL